jgi:hypothetical protein
MLSKIAENFIALYVADVNARPGDYKLSVSNNPRASALSLIDGLDDGEVAQLTKDFSYELRAISC